MRGAADRRFLPRLPGDLRYRLRADLRYRLWPLRPWLAAALAGCAVLAALSAVRPAPPRAPATDAVLAAARFLPAGTVLAAGELTVVRVPPGAVPAGALAPSAPVAGRTLAASLSRGTTVTAVDLLGPGLYRRLGRGEVAAPVRIADPGAAALARPGDLVDVLAAPVRSASVTGTQPAAVAPVGRLVAGPVRVLAVPAPDAAATQPGPGGSVDGGLLVLAVRPAAALALAGAAAAGPLALVLVGG